MADDSKGTDWMYNPNADMNKEEYLLGKAIGKNFENEGTMGQINAVEYDCAPPSIFASQAAHQVDLQRKLIEDPLVAIKKRELDDRRKILDNPVKMKALQEHIEDLKRKKKDKKKKKKRKKAKGSDSDDSDADLDLKLLKRIQKMEDGVGADSDDEFEEVGSIRQPKGTESPDKRTIKDVRDEQSPPSRNKRSGGSPTPRRQKPVDSPPRRKRSPYRRKQSPETSPRRRKVSGSPPRRKRSPDSPTRRRVPNSPPMRRRSPNSPSRRRRSPDSQPRRGRKQSNSPYRKHRSPIRRKPRSPSNSPPRMKERSPYKRKSSSPSTSPPGGKVRSPSCSPPRKPRSPSGSPPPKKKAGLDLGRNYRKKSPVNNRGESIRKFTGSSSTASVKKAALTDAEKQAKLAEMISTATWRDEQRTSRVNKYREGQEKEDIEASKEHDKNFINRELKRAQESLTVEGRITANKYKIQRGHGDMDKNFARR